MRGNSGGTVAAQRADRDIFTWSSVLFEEGYVGPQASEHGWPRRFYATTRAVEATEQVSLPQIGRRSM